MPLPSFERIATRLLALALISLLLYPATSIAAQKTKSRTRDPHVGAIKHYNDLVQKFHADNQSLHNDEKNAPNVVLVGDSITEHFDVAKFFPGRPVLNRGIGSDIIGNDLPPGVKRGVLQRMDESFFDCRAGDAFLMIGINDMDDHSPQVIADGYRQILEQTKKRAPALRVHVQSILPTRDQHAKYNAAVNAANDHLQKLAKEFGYEYIDLHSQMANEQGELKKELTDDGLHLNAEGFKIWKAQIDRTMGW
jgi:lysophospholipase L1-like esterase